MAYHRLPDVVFKVLAACALPAIGWVWHLATDVALLRESVASLQDQIAEESKRSRAANLMLLGRIDAVESNAQKNATEIARLHGRLDPRENDDD